MKLKNFITFLFLNKNVKEDVLFLSKIDAFKMFTTWQLKKIIMILYKRTYTKNEFVYKKDENANLICLLKEGKVELDTGKNKSYIEKNILFGKQYLLSSTEHYLDTARATEKSIIYIIHKEDLENLMEQDTQIGFKISKVLLEKFYSRV